MRRRNDSVKDIFQDTAVPSLTFADDLRGGVHIRGRTSRRTAEHIIGHHIHRCARRLLAIFFRMADGNRRAYVHITTCHICNSVCGFVKTLRIANDSGVAAGQAR